MPSPRPVGKGRRPGRPTTRPLKPGGKKPGGKKPAPSIGKRPNRITNPTLPKKPAKGGRPLDRAKGGRPLDRAPRDPSRGASNRRRAR